MDAVIAFASIFLGLVSGITEVAVLVGEEVRTVEILLDDRPAGPEGSTRLCCLDHGKHGAVLDASAWIEVLQLGAHQRAAVLDYPRELDERRVPDGFRDVAVDSSLHRGSVDTRSREHMIGTEQVM